jgi:hypothetical protein
MPWAYFTYHKNALKNLLCLKNKIFKHGPRKGGPAPQVYGLLLGTKYIPAILTVNNKRAGGRMGSRTHRPNICFWRFCVIAKSGDDLHKDLAKFGYKLNTKAETLKHASTYLATYLNYA